jgi:glycosyltransferase involved in cell wall biosynthesis
MRIGIDIRPLRDIKTGIGRYILSLLTALTKVDNINEYVMFYNGFGPGVPDGLPFAPNSRLRAYHWPRKILTGVWAYSEFPRLENLLSDIDIFHAPGFQVPPSKRLPRIFTIYDLIPITHPEMAIPSAARHVRPRLKHYIDRADFVIAISKATATDLTSTLGVPNEKIITIYPGTTPIARASPKQILKLKSKFGIKRDYLLFVSRIDPRKNLPRLMRAFDISGLAQDFDLAIVGPRGWHMEETIETWQNIKCKNQIRWLDYVTEEDLAALYSGALFFTYPSLIEGFGLPILEAMSAGCPVLTSNISSMPEAAGDAAIYVDPYDVESIATGLRQLAENSELRAEFIQRGYERARKFSWENTAKGMVEVYCKAYELGRSRK